MLYELIPYNLRIIVAMASIFIIFFGMKKVKFDIQGFATIAVIVGVKLVSTLLFVTLYIEVTNYDTWFFEAIVALIIIILLWTKTNPWIVKGALYAGGAVLLMRYIPVLVIVVIVVTIICIYCKRKLIISKYNSKAFLYYIFLLLEGLLVAFFFGNMAGLQVALLTMSLLISFKRDKKVGILMWIKNILIGYVISCIIELAFTQFLWGIMLTGIVIILFVVPEIFK